MKRFVLYIGLFGSVFINSCGLMNKNTSKNYSPIQRLSLLDTLIIPNDYAFKETKVGGLSGITYNAKNKLFYLISDDKSEFAPARIYTLSLKQIGSNTQYEFKDLITLLNKSGKPYPNKLAFQSLLKSSKNPKYTTPDPEDIAYRVSTDQFVWVNEGSKVDINSFTAIHQPSINLMDQQGRVIADYPLPKNFKISADSGPQHNKGLESLCISPSGQKLFTTSEYPLSSEQLQLTDQDTAYLRILQYRDESRSLEASYAYPIHYKHSSVNEYQYGVVALAASNDSTLYVLERAYKENVGTSVKLYEVSLKMSYRIKGKHSFALEMPAQVLDKKLVYDFKQANTYIDNIEGMTWGPKVNGKRTLIFVSDNNFNPNQKTIIYIFTVD